jgi:hypothetical protein
MQWKMSSIHHHFDLWIVDRINDQLFELDFSTDLYKLRYFVISNNSLSRQSVTSKHLQPKTVFVVVLHKSWWGAGAVASSV